MTSYVIPKSKYHVRPVFRHITPMPYNKHMWCIDATLYSCYCHEFFAEKVRIDVDITTHKVTLTHYIDGKSFPFVMPIQDYETKLPTSDNPTSYNKRQISKFVRKAFEYARKLASL